MLSGKLARLTKALSFRVTLWFSVFFTLSVLVVFLALHFIISAQLLERVDRDISNEMEEFSGLLSMKTQDELSEFINLEAQSEGEDHIFLRLIDKDGKILASSDMSAWKGVEINKDAVEQTTVGRGLFLETVSFPGHPHSIRVAYGRMTGDTILQIGVSLQETNRFKSLLQNTLLTSVALVIIGGALMGWIMAKRALRGVERVTTTARKISGGDLGCRVSVEGFGSEIQELADAFNRMLDRIGTLIATMREMTDNIAHDLRTPITRIRALAEMSIAVHPEHSHDTDSAVAVIAECDTLLHLINTMLDISEAKAGAKSFASEEVDLSSLTSEAANLFAPIAEDKHIHLTCKAAPHCLVKGDTSKLQRMVANVLDNALKYTPHDGTVTLAVEKNDRWVEISVTDTGLGIPEEDLPHIFERFSRGDKSRSQGGFGLGLNLALAIARAHGGDIQVTSQPGQGSRFVICLPAFSSL